MANGATAPSEIASRLALQRSNVSAVLRGLVEEGLVARTGDAADRRAAHVRAAALAGILERADASLAAERTAR